MSINEATLRTTQFVYTAFLFNFKQRQLTDEEIELLSIHATL